MDQLLQDLRYTIRALSKRPVFTAAFILTVALGMGANTCIFSIVNAVLLQPLPFREPERLLMVWSSNPQQGYETYSVSPPDFFDFQTQNSVFEDLAVFRTSGGNLTGDGDAERVTVAEVSPSLFTLLRSGPLLGRTFLAEENQPGKGNFVILSSGLWRSRYGADPGVVGKSIILNEESYRVVGVMPADFNFPEEDARLWIPRVFQPAEQTERTRNFRIYNVLARLKPGVTLESAQAEMSTIAARLASEHPEDNTGWSVQLVPLREQIVGEVRPILLLLQGAVLFVLLMVGANLTNLLLVRALAREREICIRIALGTQRARLIRQFLIETLLLTVAGGLLGLLLAYWGIQLFASAYSPVIPRLSELSIDGRVLAVALGLALLTILLGLVQLRYTTRIELVNALKNRGGSATGHSSQRLRRVLVIAQIAVATVLVIGTVLMIRSLEKLQKVEPGFRIDNVMTAEISLPKTTEEARQTAFTQAVVDRLAAIPGVKAAGATTTIPLGNQEGLDAEFFIEGRPEPGPGQKLEAGLDIVTPDYFRAMGIPLIKGRAFDKNDQSSSPPVVIISQALARLHWPGQNSVGQRLKLGSAQEEPREIVGIVGDILHSGLDADPRPTMYVPHQQFAFPYMTLVVQTSAEPASVAEELREAVRSLDRNVPLSRMRSMEEHVASSLERRRLSMLVLAFFAGLALVLAAVGLYGLIAYNVNERTQEIGVRMALGARPREVRNLVLRQGLFLAAIGVAVGLLVAFWLMRGLSSLLYVISPTDLMTFLLTPLLLVGVALIASWLPASWASRVSPLAALRYE
jgi:putative ABC transport system permease protein